MLKQTIGSNRGSKHGFSGTNVDPADYLARLILYLRRVASCIKTQILEDYVTNYKPYASLSASQILEVLEAAEILSPQALIGKIIIQGEGRVPNDNDNDNDNDYAEHIPLEGPVVLFGRNLEASSVLFCCPGWLEKYYNEPVARLPLLVFGTRHCDHCLGAAKTCTCAGCQRFSWSHCTPFKDLRVRVPSTRPPAYESPATYDRSSIGFWTQSPFPNDSHDTLVTPTQPRNVSCQCLNCCEISDTNALGFISACSTPVVDIKHQ